MSTIMSVYSALKEVKLLEKKIEKAYSTAVVPAAVGMPNTDKILLSDYSLVDATTYTKDELAKIQSYSDLKARLKHIKAAIATANMQTIRVAGKEYTVFEALMLKSDQEVTKQRRYYATLRSNYAKAVQSYNTNVQKVEQEAYEACRQFLVGAGNLLPSTAEVKAAVTQNSPTESIPDLAIKSYQNVLDARMPKFYEIKPEFNKWLDQQEEEFERFLADVDTVITQFNMTYEIEIED